MRTSLVLLLTLVACSSPSADAPDAATPPPDATPPVTSAVIHHSFGEYTLAPGEEPQPCIQWTLENEQAIYVQAATLSNDGFYHHSNWTVVPEDMFAGPDGFFDCDDRGFNQVSAAVAGTILMAQSTQSVQEEQRFPEGIVVKIPPGHKLIAGAHLLNTSTREVTTELRMSLEIIHPRLVTAILTPFHLDNRALVIPARLQSRFVMSCNLADAYASATGGDAFDIKVRYVLPHFHYRANYWKLEIVGGPRDGEVIHEVNGFSADPNGIAFDPPLDLTGATGLKMTCGYFNETDEDLGYGIGENEMCEMLGLAESGALLNAMALDPEDNTVDMVEGVKVATAQCSTIGVPPNAAQTLPTDEEKEAPLYIPPSDDPDVDTTPECVDTPADAIPSGDASLAKIATTVFTPRCSFNACHGGDNAQNGLDLSLTGDDLYAELSNHVPEVDVDIDLVVPGDPEGSLLYQMISRCAPMDANGNTLPHMPLNSPQLLPDDLVANVRAWIEQGALNN